MKIFVYGTLKKGYGNHHLMRGSKYIGSTLAPISDICGPTGFPKAKFCKPDEANYWLYGEVYEVGNKALESIDRLEGHPDWYQRQPVVDCLGRIVHAYHYLDDMCSEKTNCIFFEVPAIRQKCISWGAIPDEKVRYYRNVISNLIELKRYANKLDGAYDIVVDELCSLAIEKHNENNEYKLSQGQEGIDLCDRVQKYL